MKYRAFIKLGWDKIYRRTFTTPQQADQWLDKQSAKYKPSQIAATWIAIALSHSFIARHRRQMMKAEVANLILEAADHNGFEMRLREGYSGRGMFGKTTTGIIYDSQSDLHVCIAAVGVRLGSEEAADPNVDLPVSADMFVEDMRALRFDNMGRSSIVY